MNPQNPSYQSDANLPEPQSQTSNSDQAALAPAAQPQPQTDTPATPTEPAKTQNPPSMPPPLPTNNQPTDQPSSDNPTQVNTPPVAEDNDLIEQEWVDKAKAIVESNRDDPHKLNEQLNKFKAEYIKKRYNKEIKIDVDQQ